MPEFKSTCCPQDRTREAILKGRNRIERIHLNLAKKMDCNQMKTTLECTILK
jgi:hypothetical protein